MLFGKHVNKFYKKYFFPLFIGIVFLIFIDIVQLQAPKIMGHLTKGLKDETLTQEVLNQDCINLLIIAGIMLVGRFVWRVCILQSAFKITADLRKEMFVKVEGLSQNYYQKNKVGGIMSYFTNDLDTIQEAYGWGTVMLIDSTFLGVLAFYKMCTVEWRLALICLIPLSVLCVTVYFIDKKMSKIYEERQIAFEKMSDFAQELFTGLRVIKAFVREVKEAIRFRKVNELNRQKDIALVKFSIFLDCSIDLLIEFMYVIGMFVGAYFICADVFNFTIDKLVEFIGYLGTIIWPMIALGSIISLRSRAKTSLKRVSSLLDEKVDVYDELIQETEPVKGKITFKDFTYHYDGSDVNVLKNISLEINQGENIGVIGKIGSGKSTLVNALLRVDNVEDGMIFIDGVDINRIGIKKVRDSVSFVPQDNFLFSTTIQDNIAFCDKNLSLEQAEEAAAFADVDNNIKDFADAYQTLVGERGVTLSGGQKQRISIARAYIKHAPIMILDDSLSAVDVKTEEKILKNIKEKRANQTTILVSSRVSTVSHLDKIIVLNEGELEAYGSHEELMKISPTYQRMVYLQELEKEVEGGNELC